MPNWCYNSVKISHPEPAIIEWLKEVCLDNSGREWWGFCNAIIPVPEELRDQRTSSHGGEDAEEKDQLRARLLEKYGYESWYDFCVNEWGTKWEVSAELYDDNLGEGGDEDRFIQISFDSAWSPPVGVYRALEEKGYKVRAFYWEPGGAFCGKFEDGDDDYREYSGETSASVRAIVGDELDDFWDIAGELATWEEDEPEYPDAKVVVDWLEEGEQQLGLEPLIKKDK